MEKISVTVRVRPLSKAEAAKGSPWKLDRVFGSDATTLEIYEAHTKDIIGSAVQGFNGTVFAYGQTSSGKTYTMRGSPQEPGIIPLAVHEVFRNIQAVKTREFLLRVSYMEIYNEEINDLLAPEAQKLQIHENVERGIYVAGLREEIVVSPEQVLELMEFGENHRHVGETNMNVYSSRSHTIFRMVIESRDRSQDDPCGNNSLQVSDAVRVSVLNLVDLAGSERVAKSGAEGARLKEGTHINKSLMTLGTVINKLSEGIQKQGGHVPYRDSKLTRILQPALGGNAKTAIICNVTPALVHTDETKGTLYFASRANRVTNCAQVNEIMTDAALLKRQKKEIEELRTKLQESHSEHWEEEILHLRNALLKTELDRERMALELQEEKKAQAERERRLREQEQKIENLSTMVINSAVDDRDFDKRSKKELLLLRDKEFQVLEHNLKDLEAKAFASTEDVERHSLEQRVKVLEQALQEAATEKAHMIQKGETMQVTIQVLEGERDALIETSKQAQADMDRLQGKRRQELKEAQNKLELAQTDTLAVVEQLRVMDSFLAQKEVESRALQQKFQAVQAENEVIRTAMAKTLAETERMLIKKQNDEAQEELKALDEELARQRWDNEEVVSALEEANSAAAQAALVTKELQLRLSETEDRRQFLEEEIVHLKSEAAAAKADLETRTCELLLVEKNLELARSECSSSRIENEEMGTLLSQKNATLEMLSVDMQNLETQFAAVKQELAVRVHELEEFVFKNSEEKLALLKKQELLQSTLSKVEGERDDLQKSCEVIQHDMNRLAEKMEQQETKLTDRISELKQLHFTEAAQLRSDILVLRKELNAAKSAPAALEKERDGLGKELEKLKVKMKDIEAKLKSTLIEKSKVEAEKVNIDRELKQLRQSTALLNKRESIVDKRRESIATGLNKTKAQLSTAHHALQMKTIELEKTSFDLQLLQDTYAKLEFAMSEMECDLTAVKEKLAEAEMAITVLGQEKESAADGMEKVAKELEMALEQQRVTAAELEALQAEHLSLVLKLQDCGTASKDAEKLAKDLALEKDKLTQQLTDAFFEFEDEKAAWALLRSNHDADLEDQQECQRKLEEAIAFEKEKLESSQVNCKDLEEQIVYANSALKGEHDARMKLSEELQLRSAIGVKETLLSELDNAGMNIKTLGLEVDELQAQLDKVSSERKSLRLQTAELNSRMEELNKQLQDSSKELKQAQDKGSLLEKENDDYFTQKLKLEVGLDAVRNRMEVFQGRWEDAEVDIIELKEQRQNAESSLAASRLEVVELHVEVEDLRRQCQNCEDELQMVKRNESRPEKELERQKQLAEVISQNETLQLRVRKAEQNNKALREEIRKLQEILKTKEAAIIDLKANLDKLEGQRAKFELELVSEQGEVLSGQKLGATLIPPTTSAMPNKETQMADAPPAVGKSVQELKMQACAIH
ncbi:unnamed protein product [Sphagnum tenellum]